MPVRLGNILRDRVRRLRHELLRELSTDANPQTVKLLLEQLSPLESMVARDLRRRTRIWGLRSALLVLLLMLLLSVFRLESVGITLKADVTALWLEAEAANDDIFPGGTLLRRIVVNSRNGERCLEVGTIRTAGCDPVSTIRLNSFQLYALAGVALNVDEGCLSVTLVRGGADALVTFPTGRSSKGGATGPWQTLAVALGPGDVMSLCPIGVVQVHVTSLATLALADRVRLSAGDRFDVPSIASGSISIDAIALSRPFSPTDVIEVTGLTDGVMVASAGKTISVSAVARATEVKVSNGKGMPRHNLMPTWLEWLWNSPSLKLLIALVSAVVWFVIGARDRILAENKGS